MSEHKWIYLGKLTATQTPFINILNRELPITVIDYQIKYPRPENIKEFNGDISFEVTVE